MKILVLGWEYPPAVAGGLGAACHGLTTALADRGHRIVLATPGMPGAPPPADHPGVARVPIGEPSEAVAADRARPLLDPYATDGPASRPRGARGAATERLYGAHLRTAVDRYTREAVRALAGESFDVVHAHDWMTFGAALRLRLDRRCPVVLHVHSTAFDREGGRSDLGPIAAVERAGVRTADAVCAVSGYTRDVLVREYGVDPERVHVVHNAPTEEEGIDSPESAGEATSETAEKATAERAGAAVRPSSLVGGSVPRVPTVLFVGRLTRQKGVGFLLRAAVHVLRDRPEARFVIVGDGEERATLIELAASLGIARRVFFAGSVGDAARDRAYRSADVLVLPSASEPFGLTPLEALQRGVSVVLSDACGAREVLPSAPFVPPWDAPRLAETLLELLGDSDLRERLVARGQAEIAELSWDRSAAATERALDAAADHSR